MCNIWYTRVILLLIAATCYLVTVQDLEFQQVFMLRAFGLNLDPTTRNFIPLDSYTGNVGLNEVYRFPALVIEDLKWNMPMSGIGFALFCLAVTFLLKLSIAVTVLRPALLVSSLAAVGLGVYFYVKVSDMNPIRLTVYGLFVASYISLRCIKSLGRLSSGKKEK